MNLGLKGRIAIVTGGSKGIGESIALTLADEGAKVIICARGKEALARVKKKIGKNAFVVTADITDPKSIKNVIAKARELGGLDILVNNAGGISRFGAFIDLNENDWRDAFELNVMGTINFIREALPLLKKSKAPRIINISSLSGIQPGLYNPHYTITKAAIVNLSKSLANQLVKEKILVNVVCVGPVHSDFWDRNVQAMSENNNVAFNKAWAQMEETEVKKIPLGRIGEGDDISGLVAFLASDKASWITGACFNVDGGKLGSMC
jgi:3-oxoacyl-[acyl-carrier protein] reductase